MNKINLKIVIDETTRELVHSFQQTERYVDGTQIMGPSVNVNEEDFASVLPDHAASIGQISAMQLRITQTETDRDAANAARDAAAADKADIEASAASAAATAAARVADLEAQVAALAARSAVDRTNKTDLWQRANDGEADVILAWLAAQPPRMRKVFEDSPQLAHDGAQFGDLREVCINAFGMNRTAVLLAPSV